jgi:uncharacterized protein (TIGR03435 family)
VKEFIRLLTLALALPIVAETPGAQPRERAPAFAVASVKRSNAEIWESRRSKTPVAVRYTRFPLSALVLDAYETDWNHVLGKEKLGGATAVYDVNANLPEGANVRQIPEMLRQLLTDRFQLVAHWETREGQAYALTVDKGGLNLKPAPVKEEPDDVSGIRVLMTPWGQVHLEGMMTLAAFVSRLSGAVTRAMGAPIVDRSGAAGEFEIWFVATVPGASADSLSQRPEPGSQMERASNDLLARLGLSHLSPDPPDLSSALKKMGLKIERRKLPIEYLVIDRVRLDPAEN